MQCRKNITVEDSLKRTNMANFINVYKYILPILYVTKMTQNKNYSTNAILQHGRIVDNNCCVVFPTSWYKWKVPTTYLAIRTKNN